MMENLDDAEQRATSLEQQLDEVKVKPGQWLRELVWVNRELAGKFLILCFLYRCFGRHKTYADIILTRL